ncbi:histidine kinase dimerization/phosphoacceptor domain -containing protein (plasmid) [Pelagibacterium nitratireducens]|uniref:histidine kinase n=1 Tax=Pelagibacterium nitratireducens TaxID=1046114 RepID=A0ABZ2I4P2_9HYPH|tara:strand:+ start:3352 stop:4497 length:1146 start_codon:yes stop_codon:yes gene_type:complete
MPNREQYIERQKALGDFGELALRSDHLLEVLSQACHLVGRALGTNLAKILEITPGGDQVLVKAGVGWEPGIVGSTRFPFGDKTAEGQAIEQRRPITTTNIATDTKYERPKFMRNAGVVATINVPILLPGAIVYGLLQVDSLEERDFSQEDIDFVRTYAMFLGPVIDRLHKVHSLQESLSKNQRLLRELEHRIKNNIGAIGSLVRTKVREANSDETREALKVVEARVETLRLVHEQLYATDAFESLCMREYVSKLVEGLRNLHEEAVKGVSLSIDIDDVGLATDTAMPLGLIVNEFVTNSFKYAFDDDDGQGEIAIRITRTEGGNLLLHLSDNGTGLPEDSATSHKGTGMQLIEGLARQIGGEPRFTSSGAGTILEMEFPDS